MGKNKTAHYTVRRRVCVPIMLLFILSNAVQGYFIILLPINFYFTVNKLFHLFYSAVENKSTEFQN